VAGGRAAGGVQQASSLGRGVRSRFDGKPAHNIDQLGMRSAGWVAEFVDRMRIGKLAQAHELKDPLPPV
jgi:hypothetical protein